MRLYRSHSSWLGRRVLETPDRRRQRIGEFHDIWISLFTHAEHAIAIGEEFERCDRAQNPWPRTPPKRRVKKDICFSPAKAPSRRHIRQAPRRVAGFE